MDLFRALGEIEELCEMMTGQSKGDWDDDELLAFERVRRRILNRAGAIGRLPDNLIKEE